MRFAVPRLLPGTMKSTLKLLLLPLLSVAFAAGLKPAIGRRGSAGRGTLLTRTAFVLGAVGVVLGLALVSAGVYRYVQSGQPQDPSPPAAVSHAAASFGSVGDVPVARSHSPAASPSPAQAPPVRTPPLRDEPYRLVIDKARVNAGVFTYGLDANRIPQVPLNSHDVAWYDFSARPGTGGNAVFAGHVTWNGRAVFYNLDALQTGDQIKLIGQDGTQLLYTVSASYLVDPGDRAALSVMGQTQQDVITIITCGGTFFRTTDPVFGGDYTNRRVVRASLSGVRAVAAAPAAASNGG